MSDAFGLAVITICTPLIGLFVWAIIGDIRHPEKDSHQEKMKPDWNYERWKNAT
jgi:hypothetical protein